ncbi:MULTISPECIES: hypothetical protein [Pseudonocardiaceae]|uniref:Uncharacterized protein n=3 Tax=Pseudonocardiaceae TaxID=2070 RepID=A0A2V4ACF2_9PSEU|nr:MULTISPECIES: hypothetical protein [Pseudonocardiaceae]PXY25795.1 hypothetical protein BAY59_19625 [Prauserella coralliicola]MBE1579666.1 hypothetical protein [Amycolatopsis roodepoortensis]PXY16900.1 hypothetical protein BAY60_35235 [Prauserella muralis]TKG58300.1 hypothetical protein FCN18_38130 [Prauserella endophytica]TWE15113.1 hypothetical protein FHX69_7295 [Prauserella muralis]
MSDDWELRWASGARRFYVAEIVRQASYALAAVQQALSLSRDPQRRAEAWPAVQSFLTATAIISKLLWPVRAEGADLKSRWRRFRADRLRTELMVSETSALRDRKVRDSADHFDERIDDLVRDQRIPQSWADLAEEEFTQQPAPFRAIDSDTGEVLAGHDRMALTPIVTELNAVLRRCETVEPGSTSDPDIVMLLATLRWPPLPSLFAPTERPDEPVTARASIAATGPQSLEELITLVVDQLSEHPDSNRSPDAEG